MGSLFTKPKSGFIIYVQTGDRRNAGTDSNVKVILHDESGDSSAPITLNSHFKNDLERGCLDTFHVPDDTIKTLKHTAKIIRLELWKDDVWVADDWFVDKIVVENRVTNDTSVFPIFRWIKAKYRYQIKHLDTSLPQFEEYPEQRKMELQEKRQAYQFDQKVPDGPVQVKEMPSDEQFSFEYKWDIVKNKMKLMALKKIVMITRGEWDSLASLTNVYSENNFNKPKGADRWNDDLYFGLQRVASLNHSLIKLCTEIPDKLPVTDVMLSPLLEGLTIGKAIAEKRLFICDLEMLEGLPVREKLTLCAPIGIFFLDKDKNLKPVAIQLFQHPGPKNPIFTPQCKPLTWALVKMWYNNADAAYHQALTHLGYTHLLMEGIVIATHRNLSQSHPIFKLLAPHFLYLIAINSRALETLISEGGWVDKTMSYGIKGLFELVTRGCKTWRMDQEGTLPNDLKNRGLDDLNVLPCYHFRDDALLLYEAVVKYSRAYVSLYYTNDELLQQDTEIQGWASELVKERKGSEGGCGILGVPGNGKLDTREQLEQIVTSVVFICSIGHAAANFPQYEEYGFPPNYPGLMRGTPPTDISADIQEMDIIQSLPDKSTTLDVMLVTKILSARGTKSLGDFEVQYVFDPKARVIVDEFRKDLQTIGKTIKERNLHRNHPYEYLDPESIPNAISI